MMRRDFVFLISTMLVLSSGIRLATAQSAVVPSRSVDAQSHQLGLSKWPVNKDSPESSIPSAQQRESSPLEFGYFLMDVSDLAESALKRGKHLEAIKYFKTLAKAVPDKAVSYRKICQAYDALGDWKNALANCVIALTLEGVALEDFERYVRIALDTKHGLLASHAKELDAIAQHLRVQLPNSTLADEIVCQMGLKLRDNRRLKECTDRLATSAPSDPKTFTYRWAFALQRGDGVAAQGVIDEAKRRAISPAVVRAMEDGTTTYSRTLRWGWLRSRTAVSIALTLVLAAFATLLMHRRRVSIP